MHHLRSSLLTFIGILICGLTSAHAADPIKRLLDLQLRKGLITQQEYEEFMQEMKQEDISTTVSTDKPQTKPIIQPMPISEASQPVVNQPVNSGRKARLPFEKPSGLASMGDPDTLKVDLFGNIDMAVGYTSESLVASGEMPTSLGPWLTGGIKIPTTNPGAMSSQTGLFSNALSQSYWGIKASRNLDGEQLKAFIYLDSAINPASGQLTNQAHNLSVNSGSYPTTTYGTSALDGQLFSREAYMGIADATVGSLTFGRNNNLIQDVLSNYAPLQKASLFTPLGNGVLGGGGGISENSRVDYSLKYRLNLDQWNLGVLYGFGSVGGLKHGAQGGAVNLGYENQDFGVQFVIEEFHDLLKTSVNSTTPNTIDVTAYDQRAMMLAGKFNITDRLHFQTGLQSIGLAKPLGDWNISHLTSLYGQTITTSSAYNGTFINMRVSHLGVDYDFNKNWNGGFAYVYAELPANSTSTKSFKGGYLSGTTLLIDYKFNKYTDWYAGALWTHYGGKEFATGYIRNIFTTATGLRFKF